MAEDHIPRHGSEATLLHLETAQALIDHVNALLKMEFLPTGAAKLHVSPQKVVMEFSPNKMGGTGAVGPAGPPGADGADAELPCWISDNAGTPRAVWLGAGDADFVTVPGCAMAKFQLDVENPGDSILKLTSGSADSADDGLFLSTQAGGLNFSYADGALSLYTADSADFWESRVEELLSQMRGYSAAGYEFLTLADDGEARSVLFDEGSENYLEMKIKTGDASIYGYCADGVTPAAYNFRLRAHSTMDVTPASALELWHLDSEEYLVAVAGNDVSGVSGYTLDEALKYYLGANATDAQVSVRTVVSAVVKDFANLKAQTNEASMFLYANENAFNVLGKATNSVASLEVYDSDSGEYGILKVTAATGGELWLYHDDEKNNLKYVDGALQVWGKVDGAAVIYCYADLRDIEDIKAANDDADLNIKFREIDVCDGSGNAKKQIFWCSAMYDPPA